MVRDEKGGIKTVEDYIADPTDFGDLTSGGSELIKTKSTIRFEGANVIYMLMLVNTVKRPIYDILISVRHPQSLLPMTTQTKIPRLLPGKPEVVKLEFRPAHVCGEVSLSSQLQFLNPKTDHMREEEVLPVSFSIEAPIVYPRPIDTSEWMEVAKGLINTAERIALPLPADRIVDVIGNTLKGVNIFMLEPSIARSSMGLRGKVRFYCESVAEKFATYIELMGEGGKTKMILRSFAQDKALLIGYHHAVLDELDEALAIKQFIVDPIVKKHIDVFKRAPPKELIQAAYDGSALPSPVAGSGGRVAQTGGMGGGGPTTSAPIGGEAGGAPAGGGAPAAAGGGGTAPGGAPAGGAAVTGGKDSGQAQFSQAPVGGPKQEEFLIRCYKCERKLIVRVRERPAVIQCPHCGARAMIE